MRGVFRYQALILDLGEKWLSLQSYKFYRREGEKGGKADFTVILKLHAIQSVRKL